MNTCFSGASEGADLLFGQMATKAGHAVIHYSFQGHKIPKDITGGVVYLPEIELCEADVPLKNANKILKRAYPTRSIYVNNLLRRNFFQIKHTHRIYAASYLDENQNVAGGTGWAVTMGIQRNVPEIYVFDFHLNKWFEYKNMGWEEISSIPKPEGLYTGIGSRELPENGRQAIKDLY